MLDFWLLDVAEKHMQATHVDMRGKSSHTVSI